LSLFWARLIQPTLFQPISVRPILVSVCRQCTCLPTPYLSNLYVNLSLSVICLQIYLSVYACLPITSTSWFFKWSLSCWFSD
jgi:hypothetical protein